MGNFMHGKSKIILITIIALLFCLFSTTFSNNDVKMKQAETKHIGYQTFNNGLVSMKIPKGWKVQVQDNVDYPYYTFMAYNPQNPNYRIFVNLKYEGYLKSQRAKNWFARYGGYNNPFAKMPVLAELSTEYFYKHSFNPTAKLNSTPTFIIPMMNNFTVIQNFGKTVYGGDLLRATYTDNNGNKVEGIFTASPKEIGSYYMPENMMYGPKIDTYYRNVYNTMFITAPEEDFINWQNILTTCIDSIQFSDNFINGVNRSRDNVLKTVRANSQTYRQISNMVMSSWEKRNTTYDIMNQKRSDATLGYERVYDSQTGEIYKAYNGFTDNYKGKRYKPATNDMYTKPIYGYIEK